MGNPNRRILQYSNLGATIATILINALSNTTILSEKNVAEISNLYPTLFTPAGYVFSIWGIIYTLLIIFSIYQILPKQREKPFINKISYYYIIASIANIIWIILWVNEYIVPSTAMMFILLVSLVAIYLRLNIGKTKTEKVEKLVVHLPFSVYLGWITVATIANVAVSLKVFNWTGLGLSDIIWTVLMIAIATLVTLLVIFSRKDWGYSLVIIWAFIGIIINQAEIQNIIVTAGAGVIIMLFALIIKTIIKKPKS
jgi:hypothetical protein